MENFKNGRDAFFSEDSQLLQDLPNELPESVDIPEESSINPELSNDSNMVNMINDVASGTLSSGINELFALSRYIPKVKNTGFSKDYVNRTRQSEHFRGVKDIYKGIEDAAFGVGSVGKYIPAFKNTDFMKNVVNESQKRGREDVPFFSARNAGRIWSDLVTGSLLSKIPLHKLLPNSPWKKSAAALAASGTLGAATGGLTSSDGQKGSGIVSGAIGGIAGEALGGFVNKFLKPMKQRRAVDALQRNANMVTQEMADSNITNAYRNNLNPRKRIAGIENQENRIASDNLVLQNKTTVEDQVKNFEDQIGKNKQSLLNEADLYDVSKNKPYELRDPRGKIVNDLLVSTSSGMSDTNAYKMLDELVDDLIEKNANFRMSPEAISNAKQKIKDAFDEGYLNEKVIKYLDGKLGRKASPEEIIAEKNRYVTVKQSGKDRAYINAIDDTVPSLASFDYVTNVVTDKGASNPEIALFNRYRGAVGEFIQNNLGTEEAKKIYANIKGTDAPYQGLHFETKNAQNLINQNKVLEEQIGKVKKSPNIPTKQSIENSLKKNQEKRLELQTAKKELQTFRDTGKLTGSLQYQLEKQLYQSGKKLSNEEKKLREEKINAILDKLTRNTRKNMKILGIGLAKNN